MREIADKQLPLTRQLMSLFVYFHIVARNCTGVLSMLSDMRSHNFEPSQELLEMALKRMEREGHKKGIAVLVDQIGPRNWKMYSARSMVGSSQNILQTDLFLLLSGNRGDEAEKIEEVEIQIALHEEDVLHAWWRY